MILTDKDLCLLAEQAISAARNAGAIIKEYRDKAIEIEYKSSGTSLASQVVTEVDLLSQNSILEDLQDSIEKYDLAVLAEETTDSLERFQKDYFWCIDPLDGTLPFTEGLSGFSVSIALVSKQGIPQLGVVFDPVENNLYHAVIDLGAFKNNQPWGMESSGEITLVCDRSFLAGKLFSKTEAMLKELSSNNSVNIISHGGAAMNACLVIENALACYIKFPKATPGGGSVWDFAATAAIFNEMDATVSDINGQPLKLNPENSTFMNENGVVYASSHKLAQCIVDLNNSC